MAPLSAASMESHARAYPHLVKLHMLGEAADCAALLQEGSLGVGPLDRQRRLRWDERLAATHPSLTTQVCLEVVGWWLRGLRNKWWYADVLGSTLSREMC